MVVKKIIIAGFMVAISGCTTSMYNQPTSNSRVIYKPQTPSAPAPKTAESATQTASSSTASTSVIRPIEAQMNRASPAMTGLLDEGWQHYSAENYELSISVAERAMRIERQDPEVYLLLARSYMGLQEHGQAEQMAKQGLVLAAQDDSMYERLEDTLSEIRRAR